MRFSIIASVIFIAIQCFAQNAPIDQAIEIDPKTGLVDKEFPFDRSFYVKFKVGKNEKIANVSFTRVYRPERKLSDEEGQLFKNLTFQEEPIKDDEKKKYLIVLIPPLAPNGLYDISVKYKLSGKPLNALFKVDSVLLTQPSFTNLAELSKIEATFNLKPSDDLNNNQLKSYKKILGLRLNPNMVFLKTLLINSNEDYCKSTADSNDKVICEAPYPVREFILKKAVSDSLISDSLHVLFIKEMMSSTNCGQFKDPDKAKVCNDANLKKYIQMYGKILTHTWEGNPKSPPYRLTYYKSFFDAKLKTLYQDLYKTDGSGEVLNTDIPKLIADTKYASVIEAISKLQLTDQKVRYETSMNTLGRLLSLNQTTVLKWLNGGVGLDEKSSATIINKTDLQGRSERLGKNIKLLQTSIDELYLIGYSDTGVTIDATDVINELKVVITKLKIRKSRTDKIIKTTTGLSNFATRKFVLSNTYFSKVSTAAGKWIIPDFGAVYAPSDKSKDILRPFLGANIGFGPVDKDVRTKFMSSSLAPGSSKFGRYFRQHFSIMFGVMLGTIKEEGVREDLFNGVNIITGLSYRVGHVMRVSGGTLWFNGVDPNPTISEKSIKAMGYFSVSFDIEFKNASGGGLGKLF